MRVACVSHGSIVPLNRRPFDLLAAHHGIELTLIVPEHWRGDLPDPDIRFRDVPGGAPAVALPVRRSGNGSLFTLRGLPGVVRRLKPDVILLDEEPWSLAAWQVLRCADGVPMVVYSKQNLRKRVPPPFSLIRSATYRSAAAAWAVGETTAVVLRDTGFGGPVDVVPHGVEVSRFQPGRDEARRAALGLAGTVIGYAGRLVEEKGITDLLDAAAMLAAGAVTFTLLLVGAGPLETMVRERARSLGGRLVMVPAVPHDEAPAMFRLMDILALPSRATPRWQEQFGRVLVEAAATGLPIVAAGTGEIPHVMAGLGGGGRVVAERDPPALAGALRELVADAGLRARVGAANLAAARERYSQEAIAGRMAALLRTVAGAA